MRIVIATPLYPPDIGGPAKYAKEMYSELSRRGEKPRLVAWGKAERMLPFGVRHLVYLLRLLPQAARADMIVALDTGSVGLPALAAAKLLHKKLVVRIGGDIVWEGYIERTREMVKLSKFYDGPRAYTRKERIMKYLTGVLVRHADALLFNTRWQLDIWQKAYGFSMSRARVLENEYAPVRHDTAPRAGKKIFVAAGRGIVYKNIPALASAFAKVATTHPDIELDTRQLPPADNRARIAGAYALVVPSVSEVNSNFIIEGLAYGKPFLAPRDSGMHERLQGLGEFVDTLDQAALERGIEALLEGDVYAKYCERIQAFSYTHTWAQIVDEMLGAIRTI